MKAGIHPDIFVTQVTCTCGNGFTILSRVEKLKTDICSACHPFYTGTQKFVDSAGRVDAFTRRFAWNADKAKVHAEKKATIKVAKKQIKDLKTELQKRKVFGKKKILPVEEGRKGRRDVRD